MSNQGPLNKSDRLPRIEIISSERYPHHDTNTQQIIKNATAFHFSGLPVELVIPVQAKSFFQPKEALVAAITRYYNVSPGLKIRVLWNVPASNLRLEKIFHSLAATVRAVLNPEVDLIYTRNKFVALLALLFGKKFIFETYRRLGDENPKVMRWLAERSRGETFTGMVLHSNVAAESMLRAGFPKEKLLVLHNGYDNSDMLPILTRADARQSLGLAAQKKYVVYTGNMQKNKCIESLVDIAACLPEVNFLLVGGTPEDIQRLSEYAASKGAGNVMMPGRQPIAAVSQYLYASDVLIIPPVSAPLEKYGKTVLPFKIFPYLAAGRSIAAPDQPDMRELLVHRQNAILLEPDNASQNAKAIGELLDNEVLQKTLSENAAELAKSLTWEERANKFKRWLMVKWQG